MLTEKIATRLSELSELWMELTTDHGFLKTDRADPSSVFICG